jgi:two-component system, OmpR family, phosphate regulon sensor histidine kinase PhoR
MKHGLKHMILYLILAAALFTCLLTGAYITAPLFGEGISVQAAASQAVYSVAGLLIFVLLLFLCWMIRHWIIRHTCHAKAHKDSYHTFINEIETALDRITKGDFEARIDKEKHSDARYHMSDLIDKINQMASELGGMETMRQDFVSNVSHEIQSPLTSIRGFVSLLKDDSLSRDEQLHYIGIIESESLRLSKLGENLLRLSTLESECAEINPKNYSLSRQLKDVILLLEPQWSAKSIEVSLNEEAADVFADEDLLSQVWINLLNNSIKFTPAGGKITISVANLDMQTEVTISDTGIGMTEETKAHVFERFYMADKARSRSAGGSGLGLTIVKKIVQMHHGRIDVESKPCEGTTFKIAIPKNTESV